jgi:Fe-S-cluster containining protein
MRPASPSLPTMLARKTDDWFRRANSALLSQIACRPGCSRCCVGLFPITRLDVHLLQEGLSHLTHDQRQRIARRAAQQITALEAAYPSLQSSPSLDGWSDNDIDEATSAFHDLPCPALGEDGLCSLYAHRPLACRSMGIPSRQDGMVNGACDVQTFVPIVRLSSSLAAEEESLAGLEAAALATLPEMSSRGEELMLPYGFVSSGLDGGQDVQGANAGP